MTARTTTRAHRTTIDSSRQGEQPALTARSTSPPPSSMASGHARSPSSPCGSGTGRPGPLPGSDGPDRLAEWVGEINFSRGDDALVLSISDGCSGTTPEKEALDVLGGIGGRGQSAGNG